MKRGVIMAKLTLEQFLTNRQYRAIRDLKIEINKYFDLYDIVLFGSVARQEADEESDLDLLIVIREEATHLVRNQISDIVFEINLKYDTNISIVVLEKTKWDNGVMHITPFYKEIERDGVYINEYI